MGSRDGSESFGNTLLEKLASEGFACFLPSRARLFTEGETARGIHIISKGHVKLSVTSCEGRVAILKVSDPGEILGLHNCITGAPYETTAQTLQPSRITFVKREDLMRVLRENRDACLCAIEQLGRTCHLAFSQIGSLNLSHSVSERLARFLLSLSAEPNASAQDGSNGVRVEMELTHDEIAQFIGTSRETVTRALANFRKKHWANLTRSMLLVQNRAELEKIAANGTPSGDPVGATTRVQGPGPAFIVGHRPAFAGWTPSPRSSKQVS